MNKKLGTAAAGGTGLAVLLTWVVSTIADGLSAISQGHFTMPITVQAAIVGMALGPIIKWLTAEGIVVSKAPEPRREPEMVRNCPG